MMDRTARVLGRRCPLVDGLASEMLVREAPPPGINDDAVRAAVG
jgi:hypothetical protein